MKYYVTRRNHPIDSAFDFFRPFFGENSGKLMSTDIKENEQSYSLDIDMPGFEKSEISLKMDKGYLIVSAQKQENSEDNHEYITKERSMQCTRSYYLGEVDEKAVTAKYNNGVLSVVVPKQKPEETSHSITIE